MTDEQLKTAIGTIVRESNSEQAIRDRFAREHGFVGYLGVRRSLPDSSGNVRTRITFTDRNNRAVKLDF